jgi:branched-chain amino acid transport system substrate-binding protein
MNTSISRRKVVGTLGAAGAAAALATPTWVRAQRTSIKVGWAISMTGPFAGGAATIQWPNYLLWIKDVNDAGGLMVDGRRLKLEHVVYDDRSQSEEALRAVQRLINQDRVDILLPPWGTGLNLAVAPIFGRSGYPMIAGTMVTDRLPDVVSRWPNVFALKNTSKAHSEAFVTLLSQARAAGQINDRVAVANVTDQFGVELGNAARRALREANFNVVHDASYPMGATDLTPVIRAAQSANPDVFMALSYPPDTMALTDAARLHSFNPKVFYTAVGTAFPGFRQRFGGNANGVMGIGGWRPDNDAFRAYIQRHVAMHQREPDRWTSSVIYSGLQALGQAIERVGLNNADIVTHLRSNAYDTIVGRLEFENNIRKDGWLVGQWQDGDYLGVATRQPGAHRLILPKPAWRA